MKTTIIFASSLTAFSLSAQAALVHRYSFSSDATDSVGTAHGTLAGGATVSGGQLQLPGGGSSQSGTPGGHLSLPGSTIQINTFSNITFEAWYTRTSAADWARVFDFGASTGAGTDYVFYTPQNSQTGGIRTALTNGGGGVDEAVVTGGAQPAGETHIAVVVNGTAVTPTIELFLNGSSIGSENLGARTISGLSNQFAYLGRALYNDPVLVGSINEFRIWDNALTSSEVTASFNLGADNVIPEPSSVALIALTGLALLRRRRK